MITSNLIPHRYRSLASVLFMASFTLLILSYILEWSPDILDIEVFSIFGGDMLSKEVSSMTINNNILDEILTITAIVSGLMWAFSRERVEDELISSIRKDALVLAIYINYSIYILATIFVFGFDFLNVLMLNVFTILILFIVIFNWKKYQLKSISDEE